MGLTPSTFKLINNGNKAVDYTIYLDNNSISDIDTRIDDKYLKYNLNKNGTDSGATLLAKIGSNPNRVLDSGTIEGKGTNEYSLNLWITDEVDGNYSGQVFSGKLRVEVSQERLTVAEVLLADSANNINTTDPDQTFITGENPNNYIWYSGKLWRAVAIDTSDNSVKLVTQSNISNVSHNGSSQPNFAGSYMEEWLNDTTVDGFLGNLRQPKKFIKMDSKWNASQMSDGSKPPSESEGGTIVEDPVGLLNLYEYTMSYSGTTYQTGYLHNPGYSYWRTITPTPSNGLYYISISGEPINAGTNGGMGVRPTINLKPEIKIIDGNGTEDNPYRLIGDNDTNLEGTKLNTRYSGEYIRFGVGENNLYQIVSHETEGLTKITSAEPLKENNSYITTEFDRETTMYSKDTIIGNFLNGEYLTSEKYLTKEQANMIEDNTTWYLAENNFNNNYKLFKYVDINMSALTPYQAKEKVGLLRPGELSPINGNNVTDFNCFSLSRLNESIIYVINGYNSTVSGRDISFKASIRPVFNLKSNVIITSGDGTLQNPFEIELSS